MRDDVCTTSQAHLSVSGNFWEAQHWLYVVPKQMSRDQAYESRDVETVGSSTRKQLTIDANFQSWHDQQVRLIGRYHSRVAWKKSDLWEDVGGYLCVD